MKPAIFLIDNGSLQPAAPLALRALAAAVAARIGANVEPVSLLHSHKIPGAQLNGTPAEIFSQALTRHYQAGQRHFLAVPLFFGPSGAIVDYLPARIAALREKLGTFSIHIAPWLAAPELHGDQRVAALLADAVRATGASWEKPFVVLVDHGSPAPAVAAVRDRLAVLLQRHLGQTVRGVVAASMERRPEPEYDFNDPLLADALDFPGLVDANIIVAMQFLLPGRHAGPGGDVARICAEAGERHPRQHTRMTPLVAAHPGLVDLLADRIRAALDLPAVS